ncbi:hypothetical protein GCM10012287_44630 [Streptomyces daqingensis]|uniref:Uncharacterized protein n=1 Tax=Streptomyces daqingensis TaxID=1472640 RepID=A0ABQ2MNB6_9ACTN|nr:hypothetical protein GCM10012287_44630 [Streptomyces daqingensis]
MYEREVAVEDDDVVVVDVDAFEGRRAVVDHVHGHGLPAEPCGHGIGQQLLVLDDEYAHDVNPSLSHESPAVPPGTGGRKAFILPRASVNRP